MNYKDATDQTIIKKKPVLPHKKTFVSNVQEDDTDSPENDDDLDDNLVKNRSSSAIKYLPPSVAKDIAQKNIARRLAGLTPILTRIRRCLTCGTMFESSGNRTCGCASRVAGIIAGREII